MEYDVLVAQAKQALLDSELGRMPHLVSAWNALTWNKSQDTAPATDAQASYADAHTINLYPVLLPRRDPAPLLREFGVSLMQGADARTRRCWEDKLCLPEAAQLDAVQRKLQSSEFDTYRSLTESFKTALDRLVSLNVCNALLANHVPRAQATNVNIFAWGATAEYANLRRRHSIKPLVYAYVDRDLAECPGRALAELVAHGMRHVRESSVAGALRRIIIEVYRSCR